MGSSPEMERFGITEADLDFSLNPGQNFGRGRRSSKKHQIYGVWASDSDSGEEMISGFATGKRSGRKKKGQDYSGPISFVSGGIKGGTDKSVEGEKESGDEDDIEIAEEAHIHSKPPHSKKSRPTKQGAGETSGFGSWERHTKGIGMKLLEQMGYQAGKGLGAEGKGIVTPVQAVKREGKVAVGYYGSEKAPVPRRGDQPVEEPVAKKAPAKGQYKKVKGSGPANKSKYIYKTASEIISENSSVSTGGYHKKKHLFVKDSAMSKMKVIDMTGREQRVYSGYHHLSRAPTIDQGPAPGEDQQQSSGRKFDMPVLLHNLDLLITDVEEAIITGDQRKIADSDSQVNLRHEIETLNKLVTSEEDEIGRLQGALDLITEFDFRLASGCKLSPGEVGDWISRARSQLGAMPELTALVVGMARPLLAQSLTDWQPLHDPLLALPLLTEWRGLLDNDIAAFDSLLQASWLPPVRKALQTEWNPRDSETLLQLLEGWKPLLTDFMFNCLLLNQLIYPRLQAEVERWDPLTDTVPIHSWLHPWLPWLGDQLAPAHDLVRQKLGVCLAKWHPSDGSAHAILLPWKPVFAPSELTAFLRRHILPKLDLAMQQFQINPSSQNLSPWEWVMQWSDLLPPAMLADLLEQHFFPRWLHTLSQWLSQSADFAEIGRWYAGWKGNIPSVIAEYPGVRGALQRALNMMERALSGQPPLIQADVGASSAQHSQAYSQPTVVKPAPFIPSSLREMVEQRAQEVGLLFYPVPNRLYEGKQVYRLGNLQVHMDRNVVFLWQGTIWQPVSLNDLMSRAI